MGDFKALFTSLQTIHASLVHIIRDISEVAGQADTGAERVSSGAQALAQGTTDNLISQVQFFNYHFGKSGRREAFLRPLFYLHAIFLQQR